MPTSTYVRHHLYVGGRLLRPFGLHGRSRGKDRHSAVSLLLLACVSASSQGGVYVSIYICRHRRSLHGCVFAFRRPGRSLSFYTISTYKTERERRRRRPRAIPFYLSASVESRRETSLYRCACRCVSAYLRTSIVFLRLGVLFSRVHLPLGVRTLDECMSGWVS